MEAKTPISGGRLLDFAMLEARMSLPDIMQSSDASMNSTTPSTPFIS